MVVLRRSLPWRLGWRATAGGEWGSTKWRGASTTRRRRWWSPSRRWPIAWNIGELFIKTSNALIQGVSELSLQNFGILFLGQNKHKIRHNHGSERYGFLSVSIYVFHKKKHDLILKKYVYMKFHIWVYIEMWCKNLKTI